RTRLGLVVRRGNADRRRPRCAAAEEARAARPDPNCPRRRLPAARRRHVTSLQGRLRVAIGVAVLAAVSLSLLVGAYLVRRSLEHAAFSGLRRQVALLAREEVHPAAGSFGRFLETQDERLSILPAKQARLLLPDASTGRITINDRRYLYATKASGRDVV